MRSTVSIAVLPYDSDITCGATVTEAKANGQRVLRILDKERAINGRDGQLDAVDRTLCRLLQDNARTSNAALARAVGMSPPAVVERLRRLEAAGIITGYRAQLDPRQLGYSLTVLVAIALANASERSITAFREAVADVPEVVECHHVTGTADFMLKVVAADVTAYRQLLMARVATLPGVQRVESSVVLETLKSDRGIAIPG